MRLVSWAAALAAVVAMTIACGSSDDGAKENEDSTPFAGAKTTQSAQTCSADSDCDKHDRCFSFRCDRGTGETGLGQCVYELADACAPAADADAGFTFERVDSGPVDLDAAVAAPDGGSTCQKSLAVTITYKSGPACVYNTTVEQSSPTPMNYVCNGGDAAATFGAQKFAGKYSSTDDVNITNVDVYTFTNAKYNVTCTYRNTQTITGKLSSGTLAYAYSEKIEPGQPPLCQFVTAGCTATGTVSVK